METPQYEVGKRFQHGLFTILVTATPDLDYRPIDGEIVDRDAEMVIVIGAKLEFIEVNGNGHLGGVDSRDIKASVEANGMFDIAMSTAKESARNLAALLALITP